MSGRYETVAGSGEAGFVVQGSEFVGHVRPVGSVEEAEAFVDRVREEYDDATHNVPAYRVRVESGGSSGGRGAGSGDSPGRAGSGYLLREYQSDDGEPSGSAGKPALNVLQGEGLENVVVVVTRYYGGTNLGVGGLVRAYSKAVKDAVADAGVATRRPQESVEIVVAYDDSGTVRGILESADCSFDAEYGERVVFDVRVARADADDLRERVLDATSGRADL